MELLQVATSGMDLNFDLGDLIVLGGILIPAIVGYTRLQGKTKANEDTISSLKQQQKEDVLHITNGKKTIKKELIIMIKEGDDVAKNRIDKTQERMEKLNEKQNDVNTSINEKLNRILGYLEKN